MTETDQHPNVTQSVDVIKEVVSQTNIDVVHEQAVGYERHLERSEQYRMLGFFFVQELIHETSVQTVAQALEGMFEHGITPLNHYNAPTLFRRTIDLARGDQPRAQFARHTMAHIRASYTYDSSRAYHLNEQSPIGRLQREIYLPNPAMRERLDRIEKYVTRPAVFNAVLPMLDAFGSADEDCEDSVIDAEYVDDIVDNPLISMARSFDRQRFVDDLTRNGNSLVFAHVNSLPELQQERSRIIKLAKAEQARLRAQRNPLAMSLAHEMADRLAIMKKAAEDPIAAAAASDEFRSLKIEKDEGLIPKLGAQIADLDRVLTQLGAVKS